MAAPTPQGPLEADLARRIAETGTLGRLLRARAAEHGAAPMLIAPSRLWLRDIHWKQRFQPDLHCFACKLSV